LYKDQVSNASSISEQEDVTRLVLVFFSLSHSLKSQEMIVFCASSVVDRWFEPQSGQTKDYELGICRFSAKHTALRSNIKT
jgi:hypothetical protein